MAARRAFDDPKDKPKDDPPKTPAQEYQALVKEFNDAQQEYFKAATAAKTDEERQKAFQEKYPQPAKFSKRFLELAQKNAKDPVAVDALVWVVTRVGPASEDGRTALEVLQKDHLNDPKMAQVCQSLIYQQGAAADKLLRAIMEKSSSHEAQGQATYALASRLKNQGNEKDAEPLFERVATDFKDVKSYRGTLADVANGELFEMRHLSIGKEAPDIEGEDIDGKKMKLSDYRGKVVVLDFWGNW
jgi:hypothetical protein